MIIRDACAEDLSAIMEIWNHYILTTTYNWRHEEYTPQELQQWFSQHGTSNRPVLVVEEDGRVLGFGALSTFRGSPGYRFTAEDTIYLSQDVHGAGIGSHLMEVLCERGRQGGLQHVVAMIDRDNVQSVSFHEKMGFVIVGTLLDIGEKFGKALSCVVMQKRLI